MADNVLRFDFVARDHFSPTSDKVAGKLDKLGIRMKTFGKVTALALGGAAVGGVAALGVAMVRGIRDAEDYQTLALKTAAVIKSTGNAAHISVAGIQALAAQLEHVSGVDETLIINSENVLATFTNIRNSTGKNNDIFNQATGAILDLSVAMGEDLQSATVQVGKALNDPIKGMTALQRVGVTFSKGQKDQIAAMVKSGNLMGAQKVILKELAKEFGGAAKAAGSGFAGSLARVQDAVSDAFRDIAKQLLPALTKVTDWLSEKAIPAVVSFATKAIPRIGVAAGIIRGKIAGIISNLPRIDWGKVVGTAKSIGIKVAAILVPIGKTIYSTARLWVGRIIDGVSIGAKTGNWKPLGKTLGDALAAAIQGAISASNKIMSAIASWFASVDWLQLGKMAVGFAVPFVIGFVNNLVDSLIMFAVHHPMDMLLFIATIIPVGKFVTAFKPLMALIEHLPFGKAFINLMSHTAAPVFDAVMNFLKFLGRAFVAGFKDVFPGIAGGLKGLFIGIDTAIRGRALYLLEDGKNLIANLARGIGQATGFVVKDIGGVIKAIVSPFARAGGWLIGKGIDIIGGLARGILSLLGKLGSVIFSVIKVTINPFNKANQMLVRKGADILGGLLRGLGSMFGSITRTISQFIAGRILAPFVRSAGWLVRQGANIIGGLLRGLGSMFRNVGASLGGFIRQRIWAPFAGAAGWLFNAGYNVLWGFLHGLQAMWGKVTGWVSGIASWIRDHKGPIHLDATLLIPAGRAIMGGFFNGLKSGAGAAWSFVKSVGGKTKEALATALGWIPGVGWLANNLTFGSTGSGGKGFPPAVAKWAGLVNSILGMEGLSTSLVPKVLSQMMTESGGNPYAINLTDSNARAGTPSKGILQVIDPTFRAFHWPGTSWDIYNVAANVAAALNYARHRYGPNLNGLGQGHGYDSGGIARGRGLLWKGTTAPERVLSPRQTAIFERWLSVAGNGRGRGSVIEQHFHLPNYVGNGDDLMRWINKAARQGRLDYAVRQAS